MKRIHIIAFLVCLLPAVLVCRTPAEDSMHRVFPECFERPVIGASSGAKCSFDDQAREWRVVFWHGWGDCPAGCINKEDDAWYKVDAAGGVLVCEASFTRCRPLGPEEPIKRGGKSDSANSPAVAPPPPLPRPDPEDRAYCEAHEQCFWYSCCENTPMSKLYSRKHYQELLMSSPEEEGCEAKCEAQSPSADLKVACVYRRCLEVNKDAPAIEPDRPVVWVGRSIVIGQCQDPAMYDQGPSLASMPTILRHTHQLPSSVTPGPKFSEWLSAGEKQRHDQDPNLFQCQACDICKTFSREYALIFYDDLARYESGPEGWKRVDQ